MLVFTFWHRSTPLKHVAYISDVRILSRACCYFGCFVERSFYCMAVDDGKIGHSPTACAIRCEVLAKRVAPLDFCVFLARSRPSTAYSAKAI